MQSLLDLANNVFGKSDYGKDETKILSISSTFKNPTGAGYLISGTKKAFNLL